MKRDWEAIIATLRRTPGMWSMTIPLAPMSLAKTIRQRRARALRTTDGFIEVGVTNGYRDERGVDRGTLHLRWVPTTREEHA